MKPVPTCRKCGNQENMKTLTKSEAREYLQGEINRGSITGEIKGWKQMRRDLGQMRSDLCRHDATGKISKHDTATLDAVIAEFRAAGKIGPEWNGYLTIN